MEKTSKEAMEYLVGLGKEKDPMETREIAGRLYSKSELMPVYEPKADSIGVTSLSAVAEYLKDNLDQIKTEVLVHVVRPTKVEVFGPMFGQFRQRDLFMVADCSQVLPHLRLGETLDQETFLIMMRSAFQNVHNRDEVINIASHVADKSEVEMSDDGLSQEVNIKRGQTQLQKIELPKIIKLSPYRTFIEIEKQPESEFVFRISEGPRFRLIEADGGAWRIKAMTAVKGWLEFKLAGLKVVRAKVIA